METTIKRNVVLDLPTNERVAFKNLRGESICERLIELDGLLARVSYAVQTGEPEITKLVICRNFDGKEREHVRELSANDRARLAGLVGDQLLAEADEVRQFRRRLAEWNRANKAAEVRLFEAEVTAMQADEGKTTNQSPCSDHLESASEEFLAKLRQRLADGYRHVVVIAVKRFEEEFGEECGMSEAEAIVALGRRWDARYYACFVYLFATAEEAMCAAKTAEGMVEPRDASVRVVPQEPDVFHLQYPGELFELVSPYLASKDHSSSHSSSGD